MAQMPAIQDNQVFQRASRLAANLLAVFAVIAATLFSFLFFSNVAAAWNQVHEHNPLPAINRAFSQNITLQSITRKILPHSFEQQVHLPLVVNPDKSQLVEPAPAPAANPSPAVYTGPEVWNGSSRVTLLVMGLDYRDWQTGDVPRSDSMWVVTIDPQTKTAGMMSIPRDTWVYVPGFDYAKINMAYFYGEAYHTEGGGPGLAMQTVSQWLGVPINYFVVVDFNSFVKFIDKLDGIYVDVPETIQVDPLGPGNTVTLEPGRQHLFGEVALGYARNRYTANGDFDRAKRQQQVIMGVRERVLDPKYLPILIAHAPEVYDIISSGVRTNMKMDEAIKLAWLAQQVKPENIHHATLGREQMIDSFSVQGWSIEIPIMDQVMAVRNSVFSTNQAAPADTAAKPAAKPVPVTAGSLPDAVRSEGARIMVLNGTSATGLASRTVEYLRSLGFTVQEPSDAQGFYASTTLVNYTGKSATDTYLRELMHIDAADAMSAADPGMDIDIAIVLGDDWNQNNPMP